MLSLDIDAFITITCTSYKIIPITVDYIKRTSAKQKPYNINVYCICMQFLLSDILTIPFLQWLGEYKG